jgi:hypothetical protein
MTPMTHIIGNLGVSSTCIIAFDDTNLNWTYSGYGATASQAAPTCLVAQHNI